MRGAEVCLGTVDRSSALEKPGIARLALGLRGGGGCIHACARGAGDFWGGGARVGARGAV